MGTGLILAMSLAMLVVGITFLYLLHRGRVSGEPRGQVEFIGTALSGLLIVSALVLIAVGSKSTALPATALENPEVAIEDFKMEVPANDFSFEGLEDDGEHRLFDYRGNVVLINFWATWCAPCLAEIPDLNRLQEKYRDDGFVVISISDEDRNLLLDFERKLPMKTERMRLPELSELPIPFTRSFEIRPVTFIIDREGVVRRYLLGARSYGFFEKAISPFL